MRPPVDTADHRAARRASFGHGIITRCELLALGMSAAAIQRRVRKGTLIRKYRGVYRVGHQARSIEADYLAAVRACGDGAVLSGLAAGYLFGLLKGAPPPAEVTAPTRRWIRGVKTRTTRKLDRRDTTKFRGIPVTSLPRTLVDLAAVLQPEELARAYHEAAVRYGIRPPHVEAVLARRPSSPGATELRSVLRGTTLVVLSLLEKTFPRRLVEAGLPLPHMNRSADGRYVDCRWPDYKVTAELNSYRYHHTRHAWEADHEREREARQRGDEFRVFTWRDVVEDPGYMLAELRKLLAPRRRVN